MTYNSFQECECFSNNIDDFDGCPDLEKSCRSDECQGCIYSLDVIKEALKFYNQSLNLTEGKAPSAS